MHEDGSAQERCDVAVPRTKRYTLTSDAIFNFLIIIFPIVYAIIQKWLKIRIHRRKSVHQFVYMYEKEFLYGQMVQLSRWFGHSR